MTQWWWLRHAPVIGHDGICIGQLDVAADLSEVREIASFPDDAVWISSQLRRTIETAAALGHDALQEPAFAEQHFGDWQGRPYDSFTIGTGDMATIVPPSGESFSAVCARTAAAIDRIGAAHAGRDIIVVGHAGSIRAALAHALKISPDRALSFAIAPLSLTRLTHYPDGDAWQVECVNQTR
jgi:alpha-ribazole phosphatase